MKAIFRQFIDFINCIERLRPHIQGGRYLIAAVSIGSFVTPFLEGFAVGMLVPLVSLLLHKDMTTPMRPLQWMEKTLPGYNTSVYLVLFCAIVVGAMILKNVASYLTQSLAADLYKRVKTNLRRSLFKRIQAIDLQQFDSRPAGELGSVFNSETERTASALNFSMSIGQRLVMVFIYFGVLMYLSPPLTAATVLLAIILGGLFTIIYKKLKRLGESLSKHNQKLGAFLVESFAAVRVVRATNSQERQFTRFEELNELQANAERTAVAAQSGIPSVAEVLGVIGAMTIIGIAYVFLVQTGKMLSTHLMVFAFILLRLIPLLNAIYAMQGHLLYLAAGAFELEKWLNMPQYPQIAFGDRAFVQVRKCVRVEDVHHEYPVGRYALRGLTFEIPVGKTVALVGPSGSGKSTVAALLLRLRRQVSGRVTVDGEDYWNFTPDSWHRALAVVEQEAFLFHDTLAANVAFGVTDATPERIYHALEQAHLTEFVASLPDGLNTIVGERGHSLSGGQRQRLAIARALVRDPKILILDEATSSLDPVSEQAVQAALREAAVGRTVLIIAHRLSTIKDADKIVVMKEGKVAEEGTWEELSQSRGVFAGMLKMNAVPA